MISGKKADFQVTKVSIVVRGVFFSKKISVKNVLFCEVENTDGLHILHWSRGTVVDETQVPAIE